MCAVAARQTPHELVLIGERVGFDGAELAKTSRLVAKVDSAAVQDDFELYLHSFIIADDGRWTVVQQGMNAERKQARRYHWLSEGLESFVNQPHAAIEGRQQGEIINLTDRQAGASRNNQIELLSSLGPDGIVHKLQASAAHDTGRSTKCQENRSCRICSCHSAMTCGRATYRCGAFMGTWLRQPIEVRSTLSSSCSRPA
jgi:hypothetical protein